MSNRREWLKYLLQAGLSVVCPVFAGGKGRSENMKDLPPGAVSLPRPPQEGRVSLQSALWRRRSFREYKKEPLTLDDAGPILWAGQGITHPAGLRTAPSAGALYPLELRFVAGNVKNLLPGVYHYKPHEHLLIPEFPGDIRNELSASAMNQSSVRNCAANVVISAVYSRITGKYGERGIRYAYQEVGIASQNMALQISALGLGTVFIGAFQDLMVSKLLSLPEGEHPLCIMPVGRV